MPVEVPRKTSNFKFTSIRVQETGRPRPVSVSINSLLSCKRKAIRRRQSELGGASGFGCALVSPLGWLELFGRGMEKTEKTFVLFFVLIYIFSLQL